MQDALKKLLLNRTAFVIAHRLSTVRRADAIIVLERGRVVEVGRHAELLARPNGTYARLYASQVFGMEADGEPGEHDGLEQAAPASGAESRVKRALRS